MRPLQFAKKSRRIASHIDRRIRSVHPGFRSRCRRQRRHGVDVGSREIVTLKQQRQLTGPRESIGKAVTVIQPGRMTALAKAPPGDASELGLVLIDGNNLDGGAINQ